MNYKEYWELNEYPNCFQFPSPPTVEQVKKGVRWAFGVNWERPPWMGYWTIETKEELEEKDIWYFSKKVEGEEGLFFRSGDLPYNWRSYNYLEEYPEEGISCYFEEEATSFAGLSERPWYCGPGVQVGTGSDSEPLIIPTGLWKKCED